MGYFALPAHEPVFGVVYQLNMVDEEGLFQGTGIFQGSYVDVEFGLDETVDQTGVLGIEAVLGQKKIH